MPPTNDSGAFSVSALVNVCTADRGKVYANYLSTTCNDDFGAETLKGYCTPTNGETTIGSHRRFAAGDIFNVSVLSAHLAQNAKTLQTQSVDSVLHVVLLQLLVRSMIT